MPDSIITKMSPTVWRQYYYDRRIVVFRVLDARRTTIDVWIQACAAEMFDCVRENRRLRILQDLRSPDFAQTPYSKEKGAELTSAFAELSGRVAMLLNTAPDTARIRYFATRIADRKTRQRAVFLEPNAALEWLIEDLDATEMTAPPSVLALRWPDDV